MARIETHQSNSHHSPSYATPRSRPVEVLDHHTTPVQRPCARTRQSLSLNFKCSSSKRHGRCSLSAIISHASKLTSSSVGPTSHADNLGHCAQTRVGCGSTESAGSEPSWCAHAGDEVEEGGNQIGVRENVRRQGRMERDAGSNHGDSKSPDKSE